MNRSESRPASSGTEATDTLPTEAFDYPLDERLIAQRPRSRRDRSRLLHVDRETGALRDLIFRDLVDLVPAGDVIVLNDTRVFPARLLGHKPTGAAAEVLLVRPLDPDRRRWVALVRPGGKLKPGRRVIVKPDLTVEIEETTEGGARIVRLTTSRPVDDVIEEHGRVPLPPYVSRADDDQDRLRYQTVYARHTGSVAAPTAGLHFTRELLDQLAARGVMIARVTLHVGPGTFRLVEASDPAHHRLDAEAYTVPTEAAQRVNQVRGSGGRVWAVGTTVVRTLETLARSGPDGYELIAGEGWTDLFIRPPYEFRMVDRLITNFHLPRSPLLMLVAAFAGYDVTMTAYRHAMEKDYRFYSYGDAMVVT